MSNASPEPSRAEPGHLRQRQAADQQLCWRMICELNSAVELAAADVIEVAGDAADAHFTLIARQFGGVMLERGPKTADHEGLRVFWASTPVPLDVIADAARRCDVVVVRHLAADVLAVMGAVEGMARVRACRDAGGGLALSVFGRGLHRDIFRPGRTTRRAA